MIIGYCRAYLPEPARSLSLQRARLEASGAREFFEERVTIFGDIKELKRAIDRIERGDVLVVTRPHRLALRRKTILKLIQVLGQKGAGLRILDSPVDTSTTTGRMLIGSAPLWSLGITPWRSLMQDLRPGRFMSG